MIDLPLQELAAMTRSQAEDAIRSRVQSVYLGANCVLTRILGRPKLYLSTDDTGFAGHVMLDGYWEIWLTLFFARYVKHGMTVVDVGANAGYYTVLFGDAVGADGHVFAIEPIPATADLLERSVHLNGHAKTTRIIRAAAGRSPSGHVHIFAPPGEPKNATVVAAACPGSVVVPSINLDTLLAGCSRVDLIKIDAEGAERDIFAGMRGVLEKHHPALLLEFNAARYPDARGFLEQILAYYKNVRSLNFAGTLEAVKTESILSSRYGEDWLLFFEHS